LKKIIFTFMLTLVAALAVNAQSLVGKQWCTVLNDEDGQGIAVALTFEKNGSCGMPKMNNLKTVKLESKQLVVKNSDNQEIPFYAE
jgi:hypothetical protein